MVSQYPSHPRLLSAQTAQSCNCAGPWARAMSGHWNDREDSDFALLSVIPVPSLGCRSSRCKPLSDRDPQAASASAKACTGSSSPRPGTVSDGSAPALLQQHCCSSRGRGTLTGQVLRPPGCNRGECGCRHSESPLSAAAVSWLWSV
jgi:hypothetical protein